MKIVVDFDRCQSHGVCTEEAPEVFQLTDEGFLEILKEQPEETLRDSVERAVERCPTAAIRITLDESTTREPR
jgi:ferredoxin